MAFNEELQGISTLGQPLVTEPKNYGITPESVQMLTDAFRKGYVTTNDIMEHTGAEAVAKNKASMELLNISPDIVEAQKAQANLNTARAKADINLVPEEAAAKRKHLASEDYDLMLKKYAEYGNPPTYTKDENGKPVRNIQADAAHGARLMQYENQLKLATSGLTPARIEKRYDQKLGRYVDVPTNIFGEPTNPGTPNNPNKAYDHWLEQARTARSFLITGDNTSWHPDNLVVPKEQEGSAEAVFSKPTVSAEPPAPVAASVVEPLPVGPVQPGEARAWLANAKAMPTSTAWALPDQDAVDIYQSYQQHLQKPVVEPVTVSTPTHDVVVTPKSTPPVQPRGLQPSADVPGGAVEPRFSQESSIPGGIATRVDTAKTTAAMRGAELYKNWAEKAPTIRWAREVIERYKTNPEKVTNQLDLDLARAATLLGSPSSGGGARGPIEERVKSIEDAAPLLEQLTNLPQKAFKLERFEEPTRRRIIESLERKAQAVENDARGVLKSGYQQILAEGGDPELDLFGPEKELLNASGGSAATGMSREVTLGGKKYRVAF